MDYFDILLAKKINGGGTNAIYKQTLSNLPSPIATFNGADAPIDSLKASIVGVQDLHGYDKPWVGGAGKNKLPLVLDDIKARNTSGTWNGNAYIVSGVTLTVQTDNSGNVTGVNANGTASAQIIFELGMSPSTGTFIVNGCPSGGNIDSGYSIYMTGVYKYDIGSGVEITLSGTSYATSILIRANTNVSNKVFYPMIRLSTETDPTFAPYSNICPISGWTGCEVTDNNDTYTIPFKDSSDNPITVYGGGIDVTGGKLTATHANIASYNGEAINEPWISSEDAYASGTTPTTGAQVVYPLTTPLEYNFTPVNIRTDGITNLFVNCGEVTECKYFSDNP